MAYDPSIFNISPYYDDYDPANRFLRILFKPGYAVQARELTQMQSILQDQISKIGDHLFKDGSRIVGAPISVRNTNFLGLNTGLTRCRLHGERIHMSMVRHQRDRQDKSRTRRTSHLFQMDMNG